MVLKQPGIFENEIHILQTSDISFPFLFFVLSETCYAVNCNVKTAEINLLWTTDGLTLRSVWIMENNAGITFTHFPVAEKSTSK